MECPIPLGAGIVRDAGVGLEACAGFSLLGRLGTASGDTRRALIDIH